MHSASLLHRDMKPSNLLLNSDCLMKVADFGLARSLKPKDDNDVKRQQQQYDDARGSHLTDYVATRWYRAPEILLGNPDYTYGVDMWALGCILAEMILVKPVFPGSSTMNQLEKIVTVTGDIDTLKTTCSHLPVKTLLDDLQTRVKPVEPADVRWRNTFPTASPEALDLLKKLLALESSKRITAADALTHKYVEKFHMPEVERNWHRDTPACAPISDWEKKSTAAYRDLLYSEINKGRGIGGRGGSGANSMRSEGYMRSER